MKKYFTKRSIGIFLSFLAIFIIIFLGNRVKSQSEYIKTINKNSHKTFITTLKLVTAGENNLSKEERADVKISLNLAYQNLLDGSNKNDVRDFEYCFGDIVYVTDSSVLNEFSVLVEELDSALYEDFYNSKPKDYGYENAFKNDSKSYDIFMKMGSILDKYYFKN